MWSIERKFDVNRLASCKSSRIIFCNFWAVKFLHLWQMQNVFFHKALYNKTLIRSEKHHEQLRSYWDCVAFTSFHIVQKFKNEGKQCQLRHIVIPLVVSSCLCNRGIRCANMHFERTKQLLEVVRMQNLLISGGETIKHLSHLLAKAWHHSSDVLQSKKKVFIKH